MKKLMPISLILFTFLLPVSPSVFACDMVSPYIQLDDGLNECYIYPDSETFFDESSINNACSEISLTNSDKEIVLETLEQYKSDYGYTHIKKQTDEEFGEFQNEVKEVNSAVCDCSKIIFHERIGHWTIYTEAFKDSCSFSTACYQPPLYCSNSVYFKPVLFSIVGGILIIGSTIGIIFLFRRYKK